MATNFQQVLRIDFLESPEMAEAFAGSLTPENFREFLLASNEPVLIKAFTSQANSPAAHTKLFDKLTDYYFTGGMPEAVST